MGSSTRASSNFSTSRPCGAFLRGRTVENKRVTLGGNIKNVFGRDMYGAAPPFEGRSLFTCAFRQIVRLRWVDEASKIEL